MREESHPDTGGEPMSEKTILFTVEEGIGTITLNRPDVLNAFNDHMFAEMRDVLKRAERDASIRCLVITGAGRAFCAGQDLASLKPALEKGEPLSYGDLLRRTYNPLILKLRTLEKPIIAAINGVAAGAGFSLALACDVRLAAQSARFTQAFVRIGLVPDSGSTFFLPRIVGWTKAIELAMTGDPIDAQTAAELGLVTKVVPA
ncbi:MAG: 2-(1,2-epoxy-1,2-dihydrophenyl)acetyl-CoA isomerase [Acidobacteria bacterium]|nr:MAG: 2-(1,2-epoxy-1,2-dihydrophenyl)acetyl-CoA isomerase [Acidobacteriota bacterium]